MLVSGVVIPDSKLSRAVRTVSEALPSEALSHVHAVGTGVASGTRAWVVLAVWAVVSPVLPAKFVRRE